MQRISTVTVPVKKGAGWGHPAITGPWPSWTSCCVSATRARSLGIRGCSWTRPWVCSCVWLPVRYVPWLVAVPSMGCFLQYIILFHVWKECWRIFPCLGNEVKGWAAFLACLLPVEIGGQGWSAKEEWQTLKFGVVLEVVFCLYLMWVRSTC